METEKLGFLNNSRVLDRVLRRTQEKQHDSCDIKNMLMESFNYVTVQKTYSKKSWHRIGSPTYYSKTEFISYEMLDIDIKNDSEEKILFKKKYRDHAVIMNIGDLRVLIIDRKILAAENRASYEEKLKKKKEEYEAYMSPPAPGTTKEELELRRMLQSPWYYDYLSSEKYTENSMSDYAVLNGSGSVTGCKNYDVLENHLIEVVSDYMVAFKVNAIKNCDPRSLVEQYLVHFK